ARVPIAGTDYSSRPYSYDDVDGDLQLKHFALQKEDLELKIPYIKRAQSVSPNGFRLFGSPWAPPAWMKDNHKFNESGALRGPIGGQYYDTFANYFVKFLDAYKSAGIEFWGLTVENEPIQGMMNKKHPFNCLNISPSAEADFVRTNLGPALKRAGYGSDKLNLMIYDDSAAQIEDYANATVASGAAQYVSGIAYHWYGNDKLKHGFPDQVLDDMHRLYPQWFVLNTEACHLDGLGIGSWEYGMRYAFDIIRVLNHWVNGWVEWNLAVDMTGGPRWPEKQGYGHAINVDPVRGEAYKNPSFYSLGHFSKFLPKDSLRIRHRVTVSDDDSGVSVLTAKRPDNQIVLVVLNTNSEERVLNVNTSGQWLSHTIPAYGLQTYIW
ncbi:unnamed protein product, partial [Medioppia subpectinata]